MNDLPLIHWGIPGMRWGVRRNRVLKPTYQYRDSKGNLVSRYGKGPYGGGPKPTSRGDSKFYKEANKQVANLKSNPPLSKSIQQKYGHESASSLINSIKPVAKKVAITTVQIYAGYKIGQIIGNTMYNIMTK